MLRYQVVFSYVAAFLGIWMALCTYLRSYEVASQVREVVHILPMYALITFGAYSLGTIGLNLMSVRDCPDAAKELDEQIKEAKKDLMKKGIIN